MAPSAKVPDHLAVLLQGRVAGELHRQSRGNSYEFVYEDHWRNDREAVPLSLSMPLAARRYTGDVVTYFLRALLPDSEARLNAIAFEVGAEPDDVFALLAFAGEDCPGAVQFVRPDRVEAITGDGRHTIEWLSDDEFAQTIRDLGSGNEIGAHVLATGHFSLPGALNKVALTFDPRRERWGLPSGRAASTHIIKPPLRGVKYHNENEYLSMELARLAGNQAARASILRVEGQTAIAVERFDRERHGAGIVRVHQEDLSQALGVNPRLKYSTEGAPGMADAVRLLREYATLDEVYAFVRGVAFNWIIAGTDAHPRNYSVLLRSGSAVTLAPLYDLATGLLLPTRTPVDELPFAMTVGGRSRIGDIGWSEWVEQAHVLRLNPARVLEEVAASVGSVMQSAESLRESAAAQRIDDRFVKRYTTRVVGRAKVLNATFRQPRGRSRPG
jgi:serine/threonine-protein kinase HipA